MKTRATKAIAIQGTYAIQGNNEPVQHIHPPRIATKAHHIDRQPQQVANPGGHKSTPSHQGSTSH
ncbi:UNVERIFIED_CONTAM: hypothetical protein Slati_0144400 [Sesamum latifolium]|uniref:Uncharacterized protein n=1 Tax=Sesamum latifolium TaxID=2727402 RepID=A0AAW2Y9Q4_9LAMI